jgi:hypothetical protein
MLFWLSAADSTLVLPLPNVAVVAMSPRCPVRSCSWVAPRWLEWVCRRSRVAVGYPKGRWGTLVPCRWVALVLCAGGGCCM